MRSRLLFLGQKDGKKKIKKKKSLSTLDGAQLQRVWVESVGNKIGQFSSEFPPKKNIYCSFMLSCALSGKEQRYSAKMYTDKIAYNLLEGVRIMSLYYMHGTQRYISIVHLD